MDFSIKSLLPYGGGSASSTNVVDQDPNQMAEEFAKMLVAQISNQDPNNPMDPSAIIAQNAQFTSSLATVRLANQMAHYQQISASIDVMGRPAEYIDPNDFTQTPQIGTITGADYTTTPPGLIINGTLIPMDNIIRVDQLPAVDSASAASQLQQTTQMKQLQLIGKTVEYFDSTTNSNAVGVVDEADLQGTEGYMTINAMSVPLSDIIRVIN
jgi:flagellar basal-body rod modification protein FlgD